MVNGPPAIEDKFRFFDCLHVLRYFAAFCNDFFPNLFKIILILHLPKKIRPLLTGPILPGERLRPLDCS
jgi:hypothetical protein